MVDHLHDLQLAVFESLVLQHLLDGDLEHKVTTAKTALMW